MTQLPMVLCACVMPLWKASLTLMVISGDVLYACRKGGSTLNSVAWLVGHQGDGGSKYLWNIGELPPDYTTQQPKRQLYLLGIFYLYCWAFDSEKYVVGITLAKDYKWSTVFFSRESVNYYNLCLEILQINNFRMPKLSIFFYYNKVETFS
jgi:hypothetical protein